MATHDYVIANNTGASVRSDLNAALAAIVSNNSSSSEPATTYAYQWWADTTANVLKIRNSANNAWITLRELDGTMLIEDGSAASPGLAFADDTNTGIFSGAADQIGFATGGVERLEINSSEVVFNDPSNDVNFRVESNGNTHMLFVDAGNDRIGIGTSSPATSVHIRDSSAVITLQSDDGSPCQLLFGDASDVSRGNITYDSDDSLQFKNNNNQERLRVDSSGRLLVGTSTSPSGGDGHAENARLLVRGRVGVDADSGRINLQRGSAVSDGSSIGSISFTDSSNNAYARIEAFGDAATGTDDYPGRITFWTTADGASSPTERVRIDSSGRLLVGVSSSYANGNADDLQVGNNSSSTESGITLGSTAESTIRFADAGNAGAGIIAYTHSSDSMRFYTSATEALRIDSGGKLLLEKAQQFQYNTASTDSRTWYLNNDIHAYGDFAFRRSTTQTGATFETKILFKDTGGICFNGDTAAANALDDYEEGTWTPTLEFGGGSTGIAYGGNRGGSYVKIGRMVFIHCRMELTNKGALSGDAEITGLPFTQGNIQSGSSGVEAAAHLGGYQQNVFSTTLTNVSVGGSIGENSTSMSLRFLNYATGDHTNINAGHFEDNSSFAMDFIIQT